MSLIEQHYEWQGKSLCWIFRIQSESFSTDPRKHWDFQRDDNEMSLNMTNVYDMTSV